MTNELLKKAQDAGCLTATQTARWYNGYLQGQSDTFKEVTEDIIDYTGKATDQSTNFDNKEINSYMEA